MNKFVQYALWLAVGLAAFYGVKSLKQEATGREPTAAAVSEQIDQLSARAEQEHPDLPKTDALKQTSTEVAVKRIATQAGTQRANTAADMFWGFYWTNTEARTKYCTERGVDLTPFATAFTKEHSAELARATAIYAAAGVNPEKNLPKVVPALRKVVEQDMIDVTTGAQVPLDQACNLFNENAEQIAKLLQLPPQVKQALMFE